MKKLAPPQTETMLRLMALADSPQNLEAMQYIVFQFDFKEYEQFILECPPGSIRFNNLLRVAVFCDSVGYLVENEALDREAIYELFPIPWAKIDPIIQGMRRELDWPDAFDYFERLGRDYLKWWETKRKKIKALPPMAEPTGAPRALTTARTRAPLPARPVTPPRPAAVLASRPGAGPRPGLPAAAAAARPTLRVLAKPGLKLAGKAIKVLKKPKASRKAKPRPKARPKARSKPKGKGKRR